MTRAQRLQRVLPRLEMWVERVSELDRQIDAFYALTGATPDSPLVESIYTVEDAYTKSLADAVGDTEGWLLWWRWECDMGRKPMKASFRPGGPMREIRTIKQLARLVVSVVPDA